VRIVVGSLPTAEGRAALERAAEEARLRGGQVHVVAVVERPTGESDARGHHRSVDAGRAELDGVVARLTRAGVACEGHLVEDVVSPADALLRVSREVNADLLVIGMRRRSRVGKLVLGSTAQEVILGADCPVLTVRGSEPKS
jgi:nucleotide-binding universal stress UspA family protein